LPRLYQKGTAAMKIPRISLRSRLAAAAAVPVLAGGLALATAGPAAAYGPTQVYSIHLSANIPGKSGGGVWLWFGLNSGGSGDYTGADCGHNNGHAVPDKGNVTWTSDGTNITISGVILNGLGGFPATVTVPAATGHYVGTSVSSYITLPLPPPVLASGFSELTVAP
jgi:hypothetical protein